MGFEFKAIQASPGTSGITSDRRLYVADDDQTVVEEGDRKARFLLCAAGNDIPADTVKRLGLSVEDGRVVYPGTARGKKTPDAESAPAPGSPAPQAEAGAEPVKQVEQPEDKQRAPSKTKAGKRGR